MKAIDYKKLQPSIDEILNQKESNEIEFKTASGGFPQAFWETYSSFANTNGGLIVLGVKEKNNNLLLEGLTAEQVAKYKKEFFNNMHNKQKVNIALLSDNDVEEHEIEGCYLLYFYIPRADRHSRPVYCGQNPYQGSYRRDNEGDYHCSHEEVTSMFADAKIESADGRIQEHYGMDDLDIASIEQYRRLFQQYHPDHIWNTLSLTEFLEKLNVFRKDRQTGNYGLSFAGLLMFGSYSALTDCMPNFFPDYREIIDTNDRWVNRICPDGNWASNLFQFYIRVLPTLQSFLPKPFKLDGNIRVNETPAHIAVREALTNACVHADYTENASLTIYKFPNKLVFSNPGTMLVSKRQYYKGGESICRNKYLQTMFTFLGTADKAGSGADKIIKGWEKCNWKRPYIEEMVRPCKVFLTMPMESLLDEATQKGLVDCFGERILKIDHNQLMTLALAYSEEEITNERLQYILDMHRSDISRMLSIMCNKNLLEAYGNGRGKRYFILKRKMLEENCENGACSKDIVIKKRYSKEEVKKLISTFCKDEWRTAEEIAKYLGRDRRYIVNTVLPNMNDTLEKYFNVPHHPKEKFKLKDS